MWNWLLHFLGVLPIPAGSGKPYQFWSGFGSDMGEVVIIGGLITMYRRHNCHVHGCWRVGRHPVEGTPYVTCRKHYPGRNVTAEDVRRRYHLHLGDKTGKG